VREEWSMKLNLSYSRSALRKVAKRLTPTGAPLGCQYRQKVDRNKLIRKPSAQHWNFESEKQAQMMSVFSKKVRS